MILRYVITDPQFLSKGQWTYGPTLCLSTDTHIRSNLVLPVMYTVWASLLNKLIKCKLVIKICTGKKFFLFVMTYLKVL